MPETHIAVCVCTCRRPIMLRRCLDALTALTAPKKARLSIVIVDNEPEPRAKAIAEEFASVRYVHQPKPGISSARNAAIETAIEIDADFIAFTDDDCVPAKSWISEQLATQREYGVDVVQGRTVFTYPDPLPPWILEPANDKRSLGLGSRISSKRNVCTNNVLFTTRLIRSSGLDLRFDPRFNFCGGEDTDFFGRAQEKGATLALSGKAVVFEEVPAARCTYKGQVMRQFQYATSNTLIELDRSGRGLIAANALGKLSNGLLWGVAALACAPISKRYWRKFALRSGKKALYAAGAFYAIAGRVYGGYRVVDGN